MADDLTTTELPRGECVMGAGAAAEPELAGRDFLINDDENFGPKSGVKRKSSEAKPMKLPSELVMDDANLEQLIQIQSLLAQFAHPTVRADFVNLKFGYSLSPDILPQLDELRWTLFPRWHLGSLIGSNPRFSSAANHLRKLISLSEDIMVSNNESKTPKRSYREWYSILELIASSRYWKKTAIDDRCTHIVREDSSSSSSDFVSQNCDIDNQRMKHSLSKKKQSRRKPKSKKIEEIVLSSTSAESVCGSTQTSSVESDSDDSVVQKPSIAARRKMRAVKPLIFNMNGKLSLKEFFKSYEDYFTSRYSGNCRDKTQKLAEFIEGDIREVYELKGGRKLKYSDMKKQLLSYYKSKKVGGKKYWRKQLEEASPSPNESWDLYGMRLIDWAAMAYPGDKKEAATQLRQTFLKTLPDAVASKIEDTERSVRAATNGKKRHISFEEIMKIAEEMQGEVKSKSVMWSNLSREISVMNSKPEYHDYRSSPQKRLTFTNTNYGRRYHSGDSAAQRSRRSNSDRCTYCGNVNHCFDDCWSAKGLCRICGGDHDMKNCSRYNPRYRRSSSRVRFQEPLN